jgi:hypothetical protein
MSKNDITGDSIRSKPLSKEAEDNWDKIFGKKIKEQKLSNDDMLPEYELDKSTGNVKKVSRIDIVGQNGNEGDHYDS